jgi:phosphoribosylamine--glycine ligase
MNILLIGSNAREHALARAFARSPQKPTLFCCGATYNIGIAALTLDYALINPSACSAIVEQAQLWSIDIAFIGPEAPLANGLADLLGKQGIACIGPTQELATIETSKIFARTLLQPLQPSFAPRYKIFSHLSGAREFLKELGHFVIKPDGLTGGKGVKVGGVHLSSLNDAYDYCDFLHSQNQAFLIEEKLQGQEFSLHSFSDGRQCIPMPVVKDFKRAYAGDRGPNTGSMGSISDANHSLPFLTKEQVSEAQQINHILIDAVQSYYHKPYKGILYGSFIATDEGIKLIEFNARFGDPEALNLLALLDSDFVRVCENIIDGNLRGSSVNFAPMATVCKYAVPQGYPEQPLINAEFDYHELRHQEQLYLASVHFEEQKCFTTSSRTAAVLAVAKTIAEAEQIVEGEINKLHGPLVHRQDIGLACSYA